MKSDEKAQNDALVAFYFRENPDKMSIDKWAKRVAQLQWVLKYNGTLVPKTKEIAI